MKISEIKKTISKIDMGDFLNPFFETSKTIKCSDLKKIKIIETLSLDPNKVEEIASFFETLPPQECLAVLIKLGDESEIVEKFNLNTFKVSYLSEKKKKEIFDFILDNLEDKNRYEIEEIKNSKVSSGQIEKFITGIVKKARGINGENEKIPASGSNKYSFKKFNKKFKEIKDSGKMSYIFEKISNIELINITYSVFIDENSDIQEDITEIIEEMPPSAKQTFKSFQVAVSHYINNKSGEENFLHYEFDFIRLIYNYILFNYKFEKLITTIMFVKDEVSEGEESPTDFLSWSQKNKTCELLFYFHPFLPKDLFQQCNKFKKFLRSTFKNVSFKNPVFGKGKIIVVIEKLAEFIKSGQEESGGKKDEEIYLNNKQEYVDKLSEIFSSSNKEISDLLYKIKVDISSKLPEDISEQEQFFLNVLQVSKNPKKNIVSFLSGNSVYDLRYLLNKVFSGIKKK